MNIEQIIFNIHNKNSQAWIRYWKQEEISGMTLPGEYIVIRSHFLISNTLVEIMEAGFKIETINSSLIGADAYCDVLFKREI